MTRNLLRILWVVLSSTLLTSCGDELATLEHTVSAVTHATAEDLAQGRALPNSYLVAFKNQSGRSQKLYADYHAAYVEHGSALLPYSYESGVENLQFITALDMNPQQTLAVEESTFGPSMISHFATMPYAEPVEVASLARVDFSNETCARNTLELWEKQGRIWYAEPNSKSEPLQTTTTPATNSPWSTYQANYEKSSVYWHKMVNTSSAFGVLASPEYAAVSSQDRPIIVVMDSGVDTLHPAIKIIFGLMIALEKRAVVATISMVAIAAASTSGILGNGDIHPAMVDGHGVACPTSKTGAGCDPLCCHGTHVAGIIAGAPQGNLPVGFVPPVELWL